MCSLAHVSPAPALARVPQVAASPTADGQLLAGCVEPAPQPLIFDKAHIAQVVANFTSNAIKHSPAGSPVVLSSSIIDTQLVPVGVTTQPLSSNPLVAMPRLPRELERPPAAHSWRSMLAMTSAAARVSPEDCPVQPPQRRGSARASDRHGSSSSNVSSNAGGATSSSIGISVTQGNDSVPSESTPTLAVSAAHTDTAQAAHLLQPLAFADTELGHLDSVRSYDVRVIGDSEGAETPSPGGFAVHRSVGSIDVQRFASYLDKSQLALDERGYATVAVVEVAVVDRGGGITEGDAKRLFEEFQQFDGIHASRFKGRSTGLGLAISRRIATSLGGVIGAQSTPGSGSRFYVRFPAAVARESAAPRGGEGMLGSVATLASACAAGSALAPTTAAEQGGSGPVSQAAGCGRAPRGPAVLASRPTSASLLHRADPFSDPVLCVVGASPTSLIKPPDHAVASVRTTPSLRILIVDDTATNVKLLARTLRAALSHLPLLVAEAGDGQAGLDAVAAAAASGAPFDIMLVDGEMPVLDGYGMVAALRARGDATPALGVTGNVLPEDVQVSARYAWWHGMGPTCPRACPSPVQRFLGAGAADVVAKPVRTPDLLAAMRRVLGEARLS